MTTNNPPAFPQPDAEPGFRCSDPGMTLRDYFAAKTLLGMYADGTAKQTAHYDKLAEWAYQ